MGSARDVVARFPVTVAVVVAPWLVATATGSLVTGPAATLRVVVGASVTAAREGRWWTALTSLPWCAQWLGCLATSVATAALLPVAERRLGALRTVAALLVLQVLGVGGGVAAVAGLRGGSRWVTQLDETVMLGPGAAVLGVVLLASAGLGPLWRRRLRLLLISGLAVMALYSGMLGDLLRLFTGLIGLAVGVLVLRRPQDAPPRPSSRSETRVLVALLVALSALGPLVAALAQTRVGPLAVLRYVFTSPVPDPAVVHQVCADPLVGEECTALQARSRLLGWGSAVMSVMPVVLLLVTAAGLWRGRRAAWTAALVLNLVLGAVGLALAWHTASRAVDQLVLLGSASHVHAWLLLGLPALQPSAVAVVLVVAERRFREPAPAGALRVTGRIVAVAALGAVAVFVGGCLLLRTGFTPPPDLPRVLADLPARFLPPVYLGELEPAFLPVTTPARWLFEGVGPAFWAVVCGAALRTLLSDRYGASDDDRRRLTALAQRGGSTLSWMATWPGNAAWFAPDGRAAFAYRVIGGVALTVGGPIGDEDSHRQAVDGFLAHCRERGWTPALYSVDDAIVDAVRERGWAAVQVAEDTLLPLAELTFTGKRWQDVRTALNRARRDGVTAEATTYARASWRIREQIREISEEWSAEKGLPEMGFTLGGLAELDDPRVRLLPAVDASGTVLAVTSWMPVHEHGVHIG